MLRKWWFGLVLAAFGLVLFATAAFVGTDAKPPLVITSVILSVGTGIGVLYAIRVRRRTAKEHAIADYNYRFMKGQLTEQELRSLRPEGRAYYNLRRQNPNGWIRVI